MDMDHICPLRSTQQEVEYKTLFSGPQSLPEALTYANQGVALGLFSLGKA